MRDDIAKLTRYRNDRLLKGKLPRKKIIFLRTNECEIYGAPIKRSRIYTSEDGYMM